MVSTDRLREGRKRELDEEKRPLNNEDLKAMAVRTKPHSNPWWYLSPRLCGLRQDAFDGTPAVVREIHQYLKKILDAKEQT